MGCDGYCPTCEEPYNYLDNGKVDGCEHMRREAARVNCKTTAGFRAFLQRRKAAADKQRRQKDAPRKSLR